MKTDYSKLKSLTLWNVSIIVGTLAAAPCSHALSVVSGPSFSHASNAPLAGVLALSTDTDSRVSVSVNDGTAIWERDFFDFGTNHSLVLLGFKPNRTNEITITVFDINRNSFTIAEPLSFVTGSLPSDMPTMVLRTNSPDQMEPGYTLFLAQNVTTANHYVTIVDNLGQLVWYSVLTTPSDVRQLTNGDLFFPDGSTTGFTEANMLGQIVTTWLAPAGYPVDSHEDLVTDHGTILYLNYAKEVITNFPSSATNSNAPPENADVTYAKVVEISYTNSSLLNTWSMIKMLEPLRIDYLCFAVAFYGTDPEHGNAIVDDTSDGSIIVSLRNQDAVVKFSRTGQLKWILGPHENWSSEFQPYLLTPVGAPFAWNFAQHAPTLTPQGTLLLYDDGNCRAEPFDPPVADQNNYSRAAEFSIDETNMEVSQVWEYTGTNDDRLYTGLIGNATWLPQTGNVLVDFGAISYENGMHPSAFATNATMVRIKEVTHEANPQVVFDLELFDSSNTNSSNLGYEVYRAHRIPDLYSHQAVPVADFTIHYDTGEPLLQFSADPMRTYVVQASDDLVNWRDLGAPSPDEANGDYSFLDETTGGLATQFYRVVTQ